LNLIIEKIVTGPFQENTFLIKGENDPDLLIIDPGDDSLKLIDYIGNNNLNPVAILNTHAHLDHIGAVSALKEKFNIPFYLPLGEENNLESYPQSCAMFGLTPGKIPEVDHWVKNSISPTIGSFSIDVMKTPGHTTGSTCYRIFNHIFTGDTLFHLSIGRTDLPGGSWEQLERSLQILIDKVDADSIIHSGHGPDTTMGFERDQNPYLIPLISKVN